MKALCASLVAATMLGWALVPAQAYAAASGADSGKGQRVDFPVGAETLPSVTIGSAAGTVGATVEFAAELATHDHDVVAVEVDLAFDPKTPVDGGEVPDCRVNPEIDKELSFFNFLPRGCTVGVDCTGLRAVVAGANRVPIPDGPLFTCRLTVPPDAVAGTTIDLNLTSAIATNTDLIDTDITQVSKGGQIFVTAPDVTPTVTPAITFTATATVTPQICAGDCNGDRQVTVDELVLIVHEVLANVATSCGSADGNGNGRLTLDELVGAVSRALGSCLEGGVPD